MQFLVKQNTPKKPKTSEIQNGLMVLILMLPEQSWLMNKLFQEWSEPQKVYNQLRNYPI